MTEQVEKTSPEVAPWADSELLEALDQQAEANKQIRSALVRKLLKEAAQESMEAVALALLFFMFAFLMVKPLAQWVLASPFSTGVFTSSEMEDYIYHWVYLFGSLLLFNLVIAWLKILPKVRDAYRIYKAKKY